MPGEIPTIMRSELLLRISSTTNFGAVHRVSVILWTTGKLVSNDKDLNFTKDCSRWVPRLLTVEHKEKWFAISLDFFIRYAEEADDMLSRITESKQQSMEKRHTYFPVKVKAKQTLSKRKIMSTMFWDQHTVLLVDFMPQGTTINSGAYCATLRKFRRILQNKRLGMRSKSVLLLHDNARSHTSRTTRELIESLGWEVLDHAPYSPELSPSDFHLLRYIKHSLGGKRFSDNE
ncbi:mariner Mos1 transposase [Trichonephila clavipes]|nr:mariner Mos1 transposase [Trichonephila clavipes]